MHHIADDQIFAYYARNWQIETGKSKLANRNWQIETGKKSKTGKSSWQATLRK